MAITAVSICNSALLKIGAQRIASLDENNKRAISCKEQYEKNRDDVLRSHPWNFALKRVALSLLTTTPAFGFDYEFQLPTDCLRVISIDPRVKHSIEGRKLLADETSISMLYISKITDTNLYDPNFVEALALRLASDLAYPLVQSVNLKQELLKEYQEFIRDARTFSAQEGSADDFMEDYFLNARIGVVSYDEIQ